MMLSLFKFLDAIIEMRTKKIPFLYRSSSRPKYTDHKKKNMAVESINLLNFQQNVRFVE